MKRGLVAIVAVLALYVAARWLVLAGSGHLLFDTGQAEYGFFRAIQPYLGLPLDLVLTDPRWRHELLHDCLTVGNQVHGSLGLAGTLLLAAVPRMGMSTLTLRVLALSLSSLGLLLWLVTLLRQHRRPGPVIVLGLLAATAPLVHVKLGLVYWGTHDMVTALHAVMIVVVGGWIGRATSPTRWLLRATLAGALAGVLVIANYALLMPAAFCTGWLALESGTDRERRWASFALPVGVLASAAAAALLVASALLGTGWLDGAGLPSRLHPEHFLMLSGKQGHPFLFRSFSVNWLALAARWWPDAMPSWSTGTLETALRVALGGVAVAAVVEGLVRGRQRAFPAFLGAYLLFAWAATTWLSLSFNLIPGEMAGPQPRYYAHLYPVALALLASWSAARWWRLLPVGALVVVGALDAAPLVDLDNLGAWRRWDGVRIYAVRTEDPRLAEASLPLGEESGAFIRGYRVMERFQDRRYWHWLTPADLAEMDLTTPIREHGGGGEEYWRGVGFALSVLVPASRNEQRQRTIAAFPPHTDHLREGMERGGLR